jgi:hypothetical protein
MVVTLMKETHSFATLRQSVSPEHVIIPLSELTADQWTAVISERIRNLPSYVVYMYGAGVVNQERALRELASHSTVGQALVEIGQNLIRNLYSRALHETE